MIILLDTSTEICKLRFIDGDQLQDYQWQAGRNLAKGLLGYLDEKLKSVEKSWSDISAIGVFEGPGSFTGLRIGLTVMNTVADAQNIPIVGAKGDGWQKTVISKLDAGQNDHIVLPFYGSEAKITIAKK